MKLSKTHGHAGLRQAGEARCARDRCGEQRELADVDRADGRVLVQRYDDVVVQQLLGPTRLLVVQSEVVGRDAVELGNELEGLVVAPLLEVL